MFCTRCGSANASDSRFCFNCGSPVTTRSAQPTQAAAAIQYVAPSSMSGGSPTHMVPPTSNEAIAVAIESPLSVTLPPISGVTATTDTAPLFSVATHKFIVLSLCTFGIYELYWCYRNWQRLAQPNERISPLWRSAFAPFWSFQLFNRIRECATRECIAVDWGSKSLATVYLALNMLWRLPGP